MEHTNNTVIKEYSPFWPKVSKFQKKVQPNVVLTAELSAYYVLATSFPFPLYMEMKRSFMLFPLVALFIAVWHFISWFHLRFCRLFLGKPLKYVFDSKQSSSRFFSLLCTFLMIKKLDFQSELSHSLKLRSAQHCPKEWKYYLCLVADMKGGQRIPFVISPISIISAVWMNFKTICSELFVLP